MFRSALCGVANVAASVLFVKKVLQTQLFLSIRLVLSFVSKL